MADSSPLAGLLDRAGRVFSLAEQLGYAFRDEYDRQGTGGLKQVDPAAWSRHEAAFTTFSDAVLDLRDEMKNPPDGFAPVAQVLMEAASVAKQIRDTMQTTDGKTWQSFLEFRFHFPSIVAEGNEAISAATKAHRLDDPFAFVDQPARKTVGLIDTTPTIPKPPAKLIEAAERSIPVILADVPANSSGQTAFPSAAHLVTRIQKAGHTLAAAQWAIHESVLAGRLQTGRVEVELPSVKTDSGWMGGGRGTKGIPKDKPAPFDCFTVIPTQTLWIWWRAMEAKKPYDPCEREPKTFGELAKWMAHWSAFRNPRSCGLRAPTIANNAHHHYLESYCKESFGGFDLEILGKLRARYIVQTSKTVERIDVTTLQEIAEHFGHQTASAVPAVSQPSGTEEGEGGNAAPGRRNRIPKAEAENRIRDWLTKHAKENPAGITRDAVAAGTGLSAGTVSNSAAWKAFRDRRDAEAKPGARTVPLSDQFAASIPTGMLGKAGSEQRDALVNELIREQEAEQAEESRRHKPRHKPS